MVASIGSIVFADEAVDYDVENHEFKDVTITLHTRWDECRYFRISFIRIMSMGSWKNILKSQLNVLTFPTESEWLELESVLMSDESSSANIIQE